MPLTRLTAIASVCLLCCGCEVPWPWQTRAPEPPVVVAPPPAPEPAEAPAPAPAPIVSEVQPVPVQQSRAYPETVTGHFVSLCDFETVPDGPGGYRQVDNFSLSAGPAAGRRKFVVNITRTGAGAMEIILPAHRKLTFRIPHMHDFSKYTLLSMALYSDALRDDLRITLHTDKAAWLSHRTIVHPGWNNVLIDIQRLRKVADFDSKAVRTLDIEFADSVGQITFNLDDIMLIDNRRKIEPMPEGMTLTKTGLDYALTVPGRDTPLELTQQGDGLWRLGKGDRPIVAVSRKGRPAVGWEDLLAMGPRRVGSVEVLEHNAVRLRIANTWYFPTRPGEWLSLGVRQIRWEHTFYADGRHVTHVEFNNAGGRHVQSLRLLLPVVSAWSTGRLTREVLAENLPGPVVRYGILTLPPEAADRDKRYEAFIRPGKLSLTMAEKFTAPGDDGRDGFDESQGCYTAQATADGHCRFTLTPQANTPLVRPAICVKGPWKPDATVRASALGLPIRTVVRTPGGQAVFILPETVTYPLAVEVTGLVTP